MTRRLYWDPYLRADAAVVREVRHSGRKGAIVLDKTIFQPSQRDGGDRGVIRSGSGDRLLVTKVVEEGGLVLHKGKFREVPRPGEAVECELDWPNRYTILRRHTASHLVYGCAQSVLGRDFAALSKTASHASYSEWLGCWGAFDESGIERVFALANSLIRESRSVTEAVVPRAQAQAVLPDAVFSLVPTSAREVRLITIEGLSPDPCIGLHVRDLSEIGPLSVERLERKGPHLRVFTRVEAVPDSPTES